MLKMAERLRQQAMQANPNWLVENPKNNVFVPIPESAAGSEASDFDMASILRQHPKIYKYQVIETPSGTVYEDPRPDIPEDSFLWLQLMVEADKVSPELCRNLLYMRSAGTRITTGKSGGFVIRPEIGGKGTWPTQEMYREYAEKWLGPHKDLLKRLLASLFQWSQAS